MIRPFNTSAPSLLLGCLFSPLLLADDAPLELNQQIVSAPSVESTTVADMAKFGSKVEIVSREQIERAGPSADVSRVMQMFIPGLYVAPKNGPFDYGTYSLLGGRNDDTLILLDGVRLNNRLYGGLYLDTLPANAIERIEVLKGGQSLLFGTQAVSGVINIVTRSPQSRKASGEVNLGVDSFGGTSEDARVENIFTNGFGDLGLLAYVSHNVSDGYQPYRNRDMKTSARRTVPTKSPPSAARPFSRSAMIRGWNCSTNMPTPTSISPARSTITRPPTIACSRSPRRPSSRTSTSA